MNEILSILVAMLSVYGFYAALSEVRRLCLRFIWRRQKKIDKNTKKEYNNNRTD